MHATQTRNIKLDILRSAAAFAVIMVHVSAAFVTGFPPLSAEFFWGNLMDSISRFGVCFFVMISGALMLDEDRPLPLKKIFFSSIPGIAVLLFFWSGVFAIGTKLLPPLTSGRVIDIHAFLAAFLNGHFHLWYLYMVFGLYLATPFLRKIARRENASLVLLFIAITLVTQFSQPLINGLARWFDPLFFIITFLSRFRLHFFAGYIAYYLAGWYLVHIGLQKRWQNYLLFAAGAISLAGTILYVRLTGDYDNGYTELNLLVFLYSVALFNVVYHHLPLREDSPLKHIIILLSKMSFGMYVIHPAFLESFRFLFPYTHSPLLYLVFLFIITSICSGIFTWLMSHLPFLHKMVRM